MLFWWIVSSNLFLRNFQNWREQLSYSHCVLPEWSANRLSSPPLSGFLSPPWTLIMSLPPVHQVFQSRIFLSLNLYISFYSEHRFVIHLPWFHRQPTHALLEFQYLGKPWECKKQSWEALNREGCWRVEWMVIPWASISKKREREGRDLDRS